MYPDLPHPLPAHALPWLASFDVGDSRIDGEHRALIEAANELCVLATTHSPSLTLRRAGRELISLVEVHFESEEALFPTIGYTERQAHVREHLAVLDGLQSLMRCTADTDPALAAATARLLLVEHIIRHDLGFKTWIQLAQGH